MLYLLCSVIFASWWGLSYKIASWRKCDLIAVNNITYLSAVLFIGFYLLLAQAFNFSLIVAMVGLIGGIALFSAVLSFFYVAKQGEVGIPWTVVNLSVVIPIIASIFFWQEIPNEWQIIGLILAFFSLILLGSSKPNPRVISKTWLFLIIVSFFSSGLSAVTFKMIHELGLDEYKGIYMLFYYSSALFLITAVSGVKKRVPHRKEFLIGCGMGLAGVLGSLFFLLALERLSGLIAFPVRSAGKLVLTVFLLCWIWKEKLKKKEIAGIVIAVLSIIFINIKN